MKIKVLSVVLALAVALTVFSGVGFTVSAEEFTEGAFTYTVANGEVTIKKADTALSGDVVVPATLGGYPVVEIGANAFPCVDVTSISLPNTITSIGSAAFGNCKALTSIAIPEGVKSIESYTFGNCSALANITIPGSVTHIQDRAFNYCTGFTRVNYTGTLESWLKICFNDEFSSPFYYGGDLYINDEKITDLTIPDSVTDIGNYSFCGCQSITSLTMTDNVTSIGKYAFYGCTNLASVTMSDNIMTIGASAFSHCTGLQTVSFPNYLQAINDYAFYCCTALESLDLPDTVETIGVMAFRNCSALKSLTFPPAVKSIGLSAFSECSSLESLEIPATVDNTTSFGRHMFSLCTGLKNVKIYCNTLSEKCFAGCSNLTNITIEEGVTSICENAFNSCSGLTVITIPKTLTTVNIGAFSNCTALTRINYGDTLESWCKIKFLNGLANPLSQGGALYIHDEKIIDLTIPNSVTNIDDYAFYGYTSLTSLTITENVARIGNNTFYGCTGLTSLTIPDNVSMIGKNAFDSCSGLTSISFPEKAIEIFEYAFSNCTSLTDITIPKGIKIIQNGTFCKCTGLKSITIPDSVTSIGESAFSNCTSLTDITIPEGIKYIEKGAFYKCTGLTDITLPQSLYKIGESAFEGCTGLTEIDITASNVKNKAFKGCTGLQLVSFSGMISSISGYAFDGCSSLSVLIFPETLNTIYNGAFYGCDALSLIYYYGSEEKLSSMYIYDSNKPLFEAGWICLGFPDVDYNQWYGEAIAFNVASGIMTGYGNGRFGTADGIQRQDFVVILSRISGDDIDSFADKANFKDVPKGAYYSNALAWAKATGVSSGYANGNFGVGDKVTREQIMTFLHNFAKLAGIDVTVTDEQKEAIIALYPDFEKVSGFAKEATFWALSRGVISGKDAGGGKKLIAPKDTAKRCEVAAMFYNLFEKGVFYIAES